MTARLRTVGYSSVFLEIVDLYFTTDNGHFVRTPVRADVLLDESSFR
jgi:hypothetical protein